MELLNIQQQVQKNKEDIKQLKNGIKIEYFCSGLAQLNLITTEENVGKYALVSILSAKRLYLITRTIGGTVANVDLGLFPAVVQGEKGDKGDDGANGERGSNILGVSLYPPSDARDGDYYIQKKVVDGSTDYILNKKTNGNWYPQFSMRGNQGLPGVSDQTVVPNPIDESTDALRKINIDGIVYDIASIVDWLNNYLSFNGNGFYFDALDEYEDYYFDDDVYFNYKTEFTGAAEFSSKVTFDDVIEANIIKISSLNNIKDYSNNPLFNVSSLEYLDDLKDSLIHEGTTWKFSNAAETLEVNGTINAKTLSVHTILSTDNSGTKIKLFSLDQIVGQDNQPLIKNKAPVVNMTFDASTGENVDIDLEQYIGKMLIIKFTCSDGDHEWKRYVDFHGENAIVTRVTHNKYEEQYNENYEFYNYYYDEDKIVFEFYAKDMYPNLLSSYSSMLFIYYDGKVCTVTCDNEG